MAARTKRRMVMTILDSNTIIYLSKKVINIKQINKVKLPDAIIAATAILNNATLITNDIRLKVIADLKIMIIGMEC